MTAEGVQCYGRCYVCFVDGERYSSHKRRQSMPWSWNGVLGNRESSIRFIARLPQLCPQKTISHQRAGTKR